MGKIKIVDFELFDLLEDHSCFRTGYLDKQTGEILEMLEEDDMLDVEEAMENQQEVMNKIERDPARYLRIEPMDSREGFRIMELFAESLPESEDCETLFKALSMKKPFRNFKNSLAYMGDIRERWFEFHDGELRKAANEWLDLHEVDAELVSYGEVSRQTD